MYVRINGKEITGWSEHETIGSKFLDADFETFDPEAWDIGDNDELIDISDTKEYKDKKAAREYERIQRLTLTQSQLRRYLRNEWGLESEDIEPYLDADGLDEWEYASVFVRNNPLFDIVAKKIGKTSKDVDKMFEEAPEIYGIEK